MAGERSFALRQASPVAVFIFFAVAVLLCELAGHWLLDRLGPAGGHVWAGAAFDAAMVALIATIAFRVQVQRPFREREAELRALLQAADSPLVLVDRNLAVLEANPAAEQLFGAEHGLVRGRGLFDLHAPETARELQSGLREALRGGRPLSVEKSAEDRQLRFDAVPLFDDDGQAGRLAVHCRDLTEKHLLRAAEILAGEVDRRVALSEDVVAALRQVCGDVVAALQLRVAWIGRKEDLGGIDLVACHGVDMDCEGELRRMTMRWDETPAGRSPAGQAIRSGTPQVYLFNDAGVQDWQKTARRFGIKSMCAVPLRLQGTVQGVLVLCSRRAATFEEPAALGLAGGVAARIGAALAGAADRQRLRLLQTGLEAAVNGIFITNRAGTIEWANAAFCRLCGWTRSEIVGRNPRFLKSGEQDGEFYQQMWSTILAGEVWTAATVERRKDGSLYIVEQSITPIRDFRGEISHFIAVHDDVTAMRETEERLHHMAQYDGLTDLPNRALFFDRLALGIASAKRNHHSIALLYVDLDHFKILNDTFGLRLADAVLQQVATRLRRATRESDTVARIAGDEFCVIAPQVVVKDDAARVAQKCLEALKPPIDIDGEKIHVTASVGIALYPYDGENAETLIQRADAAMRMVKLQNRNNYKFASM